jgi:hypothetical protein
MPDAAVTPARRCSVDGTLAAPFREIFFTKHGSKATDNLEKSLSSFLEK